MKPVHKTGERYGFYERAARDAVERVQKPERVYGVSGERRAEKRFVFLEFGAASPPVPREFEPSSDRDLELGKGERSKRRSFHVLSFSNVEEKQTA